MIQPKVKLHNRFDFEIYDVETKETTYAKAENIVLNALYSAVSGFFNRIGVGTGTGTLSPTRTTLFSYLGGLDNTIVDVERVYDTDLTAHVTKKRVFSETEAIGVWTEVGIATSTTTTSFRTHALIEDAEGNPITINKTNTKIITVYATIYAELLEPPAGQFTMALGSNNGVLRFIIGDGYVDYWGFVLTSLKQTNGKPSMMGLVFGHFSSIGSTTDGTNKRVYTPVKRIATTEANGYPIRGIALAGTMPGGTATNTAYDKIFGGVSFPHSTLFPGKAFTNIPIGTGDGVTTEFDFPLNNINPESEVIYVGGVAKTRGVDYTVLYGIKSTETLLVDNPYVYKRFPVEYSETIELPQPSGAYADGAATITSVVAQNGSLTDAWTSEHLFELSLDNINWVTIGSGATWTRSNVKTMNSFTPDKYKYLRITLKKDPTATYSSLNYIKIYATPPSSQKQIKFNTPPANTSAITSDFTVDYIPKTSNFVIDLQAELVFGEV